MPATVNIERGRMNNTHSFGSASFTKQTVNSDYFSYFSSLFSFFFPPPSSCCVIIPNSPISSPPWRAALPSPPKSRDPGVRVLLLITARLPLRVLPRPHRLPLLPLHLPRVLLQLVLVPVRLLSFSEAPTLLPILNGLRCQLQITSLRDSVNCLRSSRPLVRVLRARFHAFIYTRSVSQQFAEVTLFSTSRVSLVPIRDVDTVVALPT